MLPKSANSDLGGCSNHFRNRIGFGFPKGRHTGSPSRLSHREIDTTKSKGEHSRTNVVLNSITKVGVPSLAQPIYGRFGEIDDSWFRAGTTSQGRKVGS